jgi:TonB-linked SusC/RagA family outer membrane protein
VDYTDGLGSWFSNSYDFGSDFKEAITQVVSKPTELTTNITNTLTYNKSFNNIHLNVLLGHEETNFEFNKLRGQGLGFASSLVTLVNNATTSTVIQEKDKWALRGYLSRVHVNFRNKYLITAAIRKDATSRFAKNNRSDIFPSFSVGWKLSEESFLQSSNIINGLKIRAAWGQAGNQFTSSSFAYLSTLGLTSGYVLGTEQYTVSAPTPFILANPHLKWETSIQIDFGIDASLWKGKLEMSFDYYQKNTIDILVGLPISAVSGFLLPPDVNAGKIQNKGIEFSLLYRNRIGNVNYDISANYTTVNNKVLDLGEDATPIISGYFGEQTHRTMVGFPISHFYGYKTNGIYQNQAEVDAALPDESGTPSPGDIRFVDLNKDGKVTPLDRTFLGSSTPKAFYGFNLEAKYKGFDCALFFQGVAGVKVFNNVARTLTSMNSPYNQSRAVLSRWNGEGTSNTMPRATIDDPNNNNRFSDRFIEDASYLRVQNLQFGYSLRQDVLQKIGNGMIQKLRFYVGVSNLFTLTKYSGLDPEITRGFSFQKGEMPLANGQDDGNIPTPRIIQFGAKAVF